jgi:serine/threonine protein kinase
VSPTALGSRYLLDEPIGRGGMGVVWRGRDRTSDAVYAIKVLRPEIADDPSAVARFVQERTALVRFRHPNVVTVHDMIVEGDSLALVMNLVAGGNLDELRHNRGGRLEQGEAARLIAQAASGLAAAHAVGIVHRDIKPANMLVSWDGETPQVQLADFGIARLAGQVSHTTEGSVMGTAAYLSPEAIQGRGPGPESDVYALGVTLYELLAGEPPFTGAVGAVLHAHVSTAPKPAPGVRGNLQSLIQECLAKDPRSRPSAAEAAGALERCASGEETPSRGRRLHLVRPLEDPQLEDPQLEDPPLPEVPPPVSVPSAPEIPRQDTHTSVMPGVSRHSAFWPALIGGGAALLAAAVIGVVLLVWAAGGSHASNQATSEGVVAHTAAPSASTERSPAPTPLSWKCGVATSQPGGVMNAQACIAVQGATVHVKGYLWKVPSDLASGDFEQLRLVLGTSVGPVDRYTSPACSPGKCTYTVSATVPAGTYQARAYFYFDGQSEFQSESTPAITVPLGRTRTDCQMGGQVAAGALPGRLSFRLCGTYRLPAIVGRCRSATDPHVLVSRIIVASGPAAG